MNEFADIAAPLAQGWFALLDDRVLLAAAGDDAAAFLHAQLTNDVLHLPMGEARLAGYCTPKGRLLATLLVWRDERALWLQAAADVAPALHKRLQMYVLRSKVTLTAAAGAPDFPDHQVIVGLGGAGAADALARWFPQLPAAPFAVASGPHGTLLRLPDCAGAPRFQWIASQATFDAARPELAAALAPRDAASWRLADILAGVPQITLPTQDRFVPQMVNLELLGGVNFKKGCYPGQEIVARSQYLGKLKRRTVLVRVAAAAQAGAELYASNDPGQPCGMVVNAEAGGAGALCLAEVKLAALDEATIHLGAADGPQLTPLPLPYALDKLDT